MCNIRSVQRVTTLATLAVVVVVAPFLYAAGRRGAASAAPQPLSSAETWQAAELFSKVCAGCHGQRAEGMVGPSLVSVGSRYSVAKIQRIAQQGKGKKKPVSMPAGLASPDEARLLARWLAAGPFFPARPTRSGDRDARPMTKPHLAPGP